ncbi:hypothetical protein KCP74_25205 [Salmonella enterica subsp. enterica]|nr:hypothetical protein KCP74_25205 [Salmonella enterica subsp. enterica]
MIFSPYRSSALKRHGCWRASVTAINKNSQRLVLLLALLYSRQNPQPATAAFMRAAGPRPAEKSRKYRRPQADRNIAGSAQSAL